VRKPADVWLKVRALATRVASSRRRVPVQFSPTKRIDCRSALAKDFVHKALDLDWAWISDDSTLCDFHTIQTNDHFFEKIRTVYGVDVSDISSGNIADILDRIAAHAHPIQ
jgi:hypothetical protein